MTAGPESRVPIVIAGHVDHGKSSLIGRLLADTGSLPEGKLAEVEALCARTARPFEYAFLLDALKEERAQGITIDAARVFFSTGRRAYQVIDAPGHVEFVRNMVTGAARAEAALLVIDAQEGIRENSRRHGYLISLLGIRQLAVLVNKMDLVEYAEPAFDAVRRAYTAFLAGLSVELTHVIPVSARFGDNLVRRSTAMPWYAGPTVVELLDGFAVAPPRVDGPLRFPVQDVYKFTAGGDDRRIVAGTIDSGSVAVGDELAFYPSAQRTRVRSIEAFNAPVQRTAAAGSATGITLADPIFVIRGDLAVRAADPAPRIARRLRASVFWLGPDPLPAGARLTLKLGAAATSASVDRIERVLDAADLAVRPHTDRIERNEVADVILQLDRPVACDHAGDLVETGRFVLVDDYQIRGGGLIREVLADATVSPGLLRRHPASAAVIWFTGLSGAGKTTIADLVAEELRRQGVPTERLDGDAVREIFPATGFSRADRREHLRRVGFTASRLEHHGIVVVASFVSPFADARDEVRRMCRHFVEVHVATPLEVCEQRDVKGLYARARRGEIRAFTGIDQAYEPPAAPELTLDTTDATVDESTARVLAYLRPYLHGKLHGSLESARSA